MNLLTHVNAYAQEWVWRFSKAEGLTKYVFLAIARLIPRGKFETQETAIEELIEAMGVSDSTVRRGIAELERLGEIEVLRRARRGTVHRYRLKRELQLPLDIEPGARKVASAVRENGDGGRVQRSGRLSTSVSENDDQRSAGPVTAFSGTDVGGPHRAVGTVSVVAQNGESVRTSSSEDVRTKVLSTTTDEDDESAVALFITWFIDNYPKHRDGVPCRIANFSKAAAAVRELLVGRDVAQLQAMSLQMWADTDDVWLNDPRGNDRSVFSLRHRAIYLHGLVKAATPRPDRLGHLPACRTVTECNEKFFRENREAEAAEDDATREALA